MNRPCRYQNAVAACANVLTGMVDSWLPNQDQSVPNQAFTGRRLRQVGSGATARHLLQATYAGGIAVLTQVRRPIPALHRCARFVEARVLGAW